jgi:hypothetical protein
MYTPTQGLWIAKHDGTGQFFFGTVEKSVNLAQNDL